jgi:transposase-like protein
VVQQPSSQLRQSSTARGGAGRRIVPPPTERWSARRKAEVVAAVSSGKLSLAAACADYALTEEEFVSWRDAMAAHGVAGLRINATERRGAPRRKVHEPAVAIFNGFSQFDCVIKDVAASGARLEFKKLSSLSKSFVLTCTRTGRSAWVSVMWRQDQTLGVRFEPPPSAARSVAPVSGEWLVDAS